MNLFRTFFKNHPRPQSEDGQGLVEYALILVLIAVTVISAISMLGGNINGVYAQIADALQLPGADEEETEHTLTVSYARHFPSAQNIEVKVLYDGGYDPDVTVTAVINGATVSIPGGSLSNPVDYFARIPYASVGVNQCAPSCSVIVTSSDGLSKTVNTTNGN